MQSDDVEHDFGSLGHGLDAALVGDEIVVRDGGVDVGDFGDDVDGWEETDRFVVAGEDVLELGEVIKRLQGQMRR